MFYDTGMEFQAIYDTRNQVKEILEEKNIKYTELKPKVPFLTKMLEIDVKKRDGSIQNGYGICGGMCRWGTTEKNQTIEKYLKSQYGQEYREYIRYSIGRNKKNRKRT